MRLSTNLSFQVHDLVQLHVMFHLPHPLFRSGAQGYIDLYHHDNLSLHTSVDEEG